MSTTIKPELSEKSMYWIEKHRYYELKHFCLQYPIWKRAYANLDGIGQRPTDLTAFLKKNPDGDPTARCAEAKLFYLERIEMLINVAKETDLGLWDYILTGVTEGISYDKLRAYENIPCCRDVYYDLYRRFFWLLNKVRN